MLNYQRVYNVHYWSWLCIDAFPSAQHDPVNICESMVATKRLNILLGLQVFLNLTGEA